MIAQYIKNLSIKKKILLLGFLMYSFSGVIKLFFPEWFFYLWNGAIMIFKAISFF